MVSIKVISSSYDIAKDESNKVANKVKKELLNSIVLGPTVSNVFKVNNIYRFSIIIKYKKEEMLYPVLNQIIDYYKSNSKVKIDIDFNPRNF